MHDFHFFVEHRSAAVGDHLDFVGQSDRVAVVDRFVLAELVVGDVVGEFPKLLRGAGEVGDFQLGAVEGCEAGGVETRRAGVSPFYAEVDPQEQRQIGSGRLHGLFDEGLCGVN